MENVTPENLFERRWTLIVLERVLGQMRGEFVATERAELFEELKIFVSTDPPGSSYAEIATRTGLKNRRLPARGYATSAITNCFKRLPGAVWVWFTRRGR